MAWPFQKNTEEDPAKQDQSKAEMESFVTQLRTSFEESLKPINERLQAVEQNFNSFREERRPKPEPAEPADPTIEPERWKAETLGPLAMQTAVLRAEVTEERELRNIPEEWRDVVEPRIKELLAKNTPIERKIQTDYGAYIQNCINLVIGEEARKAGLRRDPQNKRFFIEDAASRRSAESEMFSSELGWTDSRGNYHSPAETLSKLGIEASEFSKGMH